MAGQPEQSPLVGRLSPDRELARRAAFALFVRVHLEQVGLVPRLVAPAGRAAAGWLPPLADLPAAVEEIAGRNPHVVAHFGDRQQRAALASLDAAAARDLIGWLRAQRLEQEEPQIAYELAILALGVELPPILVGALRQLELRPESTVAELPDGAGYPTVFLSTLHPHWRAAERARLFVCDTDAEQLAGWAMLLLSGQLAPPAGSIVRVPAGGGEGLDETAFDVAIAYHPVPWLASPEARRQAVRADLHVLV